MIVMRGNDLLWGVLKEIMSGNSAPGRPRIGMLNELIVKNTYGVMKHTCNIGLKVGQWSHWSGHWTCLSSLLFGHMVRLPADVLYNMALRVWRDTSTKRRIVLWRTSWKTPQWLTTHFVDQPDQVRHRGSGSDILEMNKWLCCVEGGHNGSQELRGPVSEWVESGWVMLNTIDLPYGRALDDDTCE